MQNGMVKDMSYNQTHLGYLFLATKVVSSTKVCAIVSKKVSWQKL